MRHRKGKGIREKHLLCFIDYAKAFVFVGHNKLWKILKEIEVSDHLACLLGNLYAGQEAMVRTGHGKTEWFIVEKGVHHGCVLLPSLFNLCAEYIVQNAGLADSQTLIKIARRINNHRFVDTTVMAESEEELKHLLMRVKEESEKTVLKLSILKMKIIASDPIPSWQIEEGKSGNSDRFYILGLQNHC